MRFFANLLKTAYLQLSEDTNPNSLVKGIPIFSKSKYFGNQAQNLHSAVCGLFLFHIPLPQSYRANYASPKTTKHISAPMNLKVINQLRFISHFTYTCAQIKI